MVKSIFNMVDYQSTDTVLESWFKTMIFAAAFVCVVVLFLITVDWIFGTNLLLTYTTMAKGLFAYLRGDFATFYGCSEQFKMLTGGAVDVL